MIQENGVENFTLEDRFPEYTFIQRIPAIISTSSTPPGNQDFINPNGVRPSSRVSFNAIAPAPNMFLSSEAYIKIRVRCRQYNLLLVTAGPDPVPSARPSATPLGVNRTILKPGMLIANGMTNLKLRLNNHGIEYKDPRYVQKNLNVQSYGKTYIEKQFSTSGSSYFDNIGWLNFLGESESIIRIDPLGLPPVGYQPCVANQGVDNGYQNACNQWDSIQSNGLGQSTPDYPNGVKLMDFEEPLAWGPFKPRCDNAARNSPYNNLSELIPYLNQVGVEFTLKNYTANLFTPYFNTTRDLTPPGTGVPNTYNSLWVDDGVESAELVLKWVKPRAELIMGIPRELSIKSFQYRHLSFPLNDGLPILSNQEVTYNFDNIYSRQVPTQLILWGTIDKDDPESYMAVAVNGKFAVGGGGFGNLCDPAIGQPIENNDTTSFEANCELNEMTIRTNVLGGTDVWDNAYSQREMYKYTTDNCHPDFPWSRYIFPGYTQQSQTPNDNQPYRAYQGYQFMVLEAKDLKQFNVSNAKTGKLLRDLVWNFSGTLTPRDGLMDQGNNRLAPPPPPGGTRVSERRYRFHVLFMYNNYRIKLSKTGEVSSDYVSKFV